MLRHIPFDQLVRSHGFGNDKYIDCGKYITISMLPYTEQFIAHPPAAIEDYIFYSCNYRSVVFEAASAQENLTERLDTLMNFWAEAAKRRRGLCAQDAASDDLVKEKRHWEVLFMDSPATRAGAECPGSVMTFAKWVVANLS